MRDPRVVVKFREMVKADPMKIENFSKGSQTDPQKKK